MRLALIGTGAIAQRFAGDMRQSEQARIVAVGGRDRARAEQLASAIGPGVVFAGIEEAMALPTVDAVYVATSNDVHAAHALAAIRLRKPVLVEKPLATSAEDAERVIEAARSAGVFAMEAMWMRFTPGIRRLKNLAENGDLGPLLRLQAGVSFRYEGRPRDPGGALLDLGVYPVSLALHLLGPADRVAAIGRRSAAGVVTRAELILSHGSATSNLSCGWDGEGANRASLQAERALVETAGSMLCPPGLTRRDFAQPVEPAEGQTPVSLSGLPRLGFVAALRETLRPLRLRRIPTLYRGSGLHYQVDHMAACLRQGLTESLIMPLDETCRTLRVVDEALSQIR